MNRTTPTEPRFHGTVTEKSHKTMSRIRGKDTEECIRVIEETIFDLEMENNDWGEEL